MQYKKLNTKFCLEVNTLFSLFALLILYWLDNQPNLNPLKGEI